MKDACMSIEAAEQLHAEALRLQSLGKMAEAAAISASQSQHKVINDHVSMLMLSGVFQHFFKLSLLTCCCGCRQP